jgi:hypothetical protein
VVSIKNIAENDNAVYTGATDIVLQGSTMRVNGVTTAVPPQGVIYIENGSGNCTFYNPTDTEDADSACGDVTVRGTYSFDLTIVAEKDVRIMANIEQVSGSNAMLGLIAQKFIRVHHPVDNLDADYHSSSDSFSWDCDNDGAVPTRIDAAMLAVDHSFTVDNYFCGNQLGYLTVNGAIAQKFRGTVGTTRPTGYLKDYNYDDRLRYRQPPHFLDPIQTGWRVIRQTEQTPAR